MDYLTRRRAMAAMLPLPLLGTMPSPIPGADMFVLFGTQKQGPGIGFSVSRFDSTSGNLSRPEFLEEAQNPAFFVISRDGLRVYACNSVRTFNRQPGGAISAYAVDPATARLTLLNQQPTNGEGPSYISMDSSARHLLVANYHGGSIAAFALRTDGGIGERTAFIQHVGSSVNPQRQTHAFPHAIRSDPTNRFALVADLGLDKLFVYQFNEKDGSLRPHDPPFVKITPGSGPRHVIFHPNGRLVYLINEMASTIIVFSWDSRRGVLTEVQTESTLPPAFQGVSSSAEIEIHPNGRFLYASNRGPDSLAVFSVHGRTGRLTLIETVPTQGKTPKNFALDPTGRWLVVTNHGSDNATVFSIDGNSGRLTPAGQPVSVPYPFGVRFVPIPRGRSAPYDD